MHWMLLPLKRYADFQGRSRRREYWMFTLAIVIVSVVLGIFFGVSAESDATLPTGTLLLLGLLGLAILIPSIAVQVRRFHDQDKTGWLVLLGLIPYLGGLIVLVFMCLPGTSGPNRFGADPKEDVGDVFT